MEPPRHLSIAGLRDRFVTDKTIMDMQKVIFCTEQDGTPPHYYTNVHAYLDNVAPGHWIAQRDAIEYPACSPNLILLDFYLWGYFKNMVYKKPCALEELHYETETASHATPVASMRDVTNIVLKNVCRRLEYSLNTYCNFIISIHCNTYD
ncbi:hypothetical protein TNCV_2806871 [Trichonephila clavipes]|nr:hypothetical protein TNCV_2806871 [Trichonephila clavipes]